MRSLSLSLSLSRVERKRGKKNDREIIEKGSNKIVDLLVRTWTKQKKKKKTAVKKVIDNARIFSLFLHFYKYK